jgi:hypothetical protein
VVHLFRTKEQDRTVDYIKDVKSGVFAGKKPDNFEISDASLNNWLKTGTNIPEELYSIQDQESWDKELNSSNDSKSFPIPNLGNPEDIFAATLVSGFGLGLLGMVNPALVPIALGYIGKGLVTVGVTFITTGYIGNKIKNKAKKRG